MIEFEMDNSKVNVKSQIFMQSHETSIIFMRSSQIDMIRSCR